MCYVIAIIFFVLELAKPGFVHNGTVWGLLFVTLGLALGGPSWGFWKKFTGPTN
jgi:hypothetical protein